MLAEQIMGDAGGGVLAGGALLADFVFEFLQVLADLGGLGAGDGFLGDFVCWRRRARRRGGRRRRRLVGLFGAGPAAGQEGGAATAAAAPHVGRRGGHAGRGVLPGGDPVGGLGGLKIGEGTAGRY